MILSIVGYGDPVLRKVGDNITQDYAGLQELIQNMYETMYSASGVGLAAPQVGLPIRLFVIDAAPFAELEGNTEEEAAFLRTLKKTFINAKILKEEGEEWSFNEGCLSIPDIHEGVKRKERITIEYYDENFVRHEEVFDGLAARVIQHEYDHIEGVLFTDKISSLKKKLISKKLTNILEGKIFTDYKMRFAQKKGR
ncbi:peptide deformylase [Myroides pelagicus]|uniref:Peptide deformylase n=1 Tax=Myroides pelagicus TaxID=270914 RepID=A0A7K1GHL3_9FLAO|nr:peptide deformylase [Myroides pelagicus]MEC4114613.1 peptide deformylase [Myroides pelagicus]MTH28388.1 peptide deformylase [Myroides pelagicus]